MFCSSVLKKTVIQSRTLMMQRETSFVITAIGAGLGYLKDKQRN
jgi:hypothetical protein